MPVSPTNQANQSVSALSPSPALTRNQIRGFWASWGGWTLDGMDSFVYALVLVPSLRELLPRTGIPATKGNVGLYGGLLFALFLIGWGLAFLWGPIGDKFGRVRTLMLTILWYSVFTFLSAFVTGVWQLAILRLLAGVGIGGEWAMGGTFVAEEWPEGRRRVGAGLMHTGYYVGIFLAALANYAIGSRFGWRAMFIVGGLPALLLAWVRHGVSEPAAWTKKEFFSHAGFHLWSVGWNCLCPGCHHIGRGGGWPRESSGGAACFLGHHAGLVCHDSWLPGHAVAGRARRTTRGAGGFLHSHDGVHCAHVRQSFLSGSHCASMVFRLSLFSGIGRGQLRRIHSLATRAISYGVPRQRLRLFNFICAIWRGWNHLPGRSGRPPLRITRNSCCDDFYCFRARTAPDSIRGGDPRQALASVRIAGGNRMRPPKAPTSTLARASGLHSIHRSKARPGFCR
jgi:MFS family permease